MKSTLPPFGPADCPRLAASWAASTQLLAALRAGLAALGPLPGVVALAAAGSLGRMEVHDASDFDLVAIAQDENAASSALEPVFKLASGLGLVLPKANGIYRDVLPRSQLCPPAGRGSLLESPAAFGKRMALLLDAQPLGPAAGFGEVQREVLHWYAAGRVGRLADAQWDFLLHDLQRYAHAYAGWQAFRFERDAADAWLLRQAKLAGSRLLTFAGLLCVLGASSTLGRGKRRWVQAHLALTPLQRLQVVMAPVDPGAFGLLCADYEALHATLVDPARRAALVSASPRSFDESLRPKAVQREIQRLGTSLRRRIAGFLLARRNDWHPVFLAGVFF